MRDLEQREIALSTGAHQPDRPLGISDSEERIPFPEDKPKTVSYP